MMLTPISLTAASSGVLDHLRDPRPCYDWGIDSISSALTTGPGHFAVVGAKTGVGKSLIGMQIAVAMARSGLHTAYVSLEMSADSLAERYLAQSGTMAALRHRDPTPTQVAAMRTQLARDSKLPLDLVPAAGCTVLDIETYVRANPDVKVVVVDYLQLLGGNSSSRYELTTNASIALATLAHSTGVCIIGLAQLAIKGEQAQGTPDLSSIQATSQYVQDADAILLLWREDEKNADSRRVLQVAKNRHGPAGRKVYLDFDGNTMTLTPSADQTAHKPAKKAYNFNPAQPSKGGYDPTLDQRDNDEALREFEARERAKQMSMKL